MSQNEEKRAAGSEDIFNTEELLQAEDEYEEYTNDEIIELGLIRANAEKSQVASMDAETEGDNQIQDVDEMIDDTEEATADDLEVDGTEITEDQGKCIKV